MAPIFAVRYTAGNTAPCDVEFTDLYQSFIDRIWEFDFGDGHLFRWDYTAQTVCYHTYTTPGIYFVKAIAIDEKTMSNPVTITILAPEPPVKKSWWERFIAWLKGLFGR
jgi:PKD repeat protein